MELKATRAAQEKKAAIEHWQNQLKTEMLQAELAACREREGLRFSLEKAHEWEMATHLDLQAAIERHLADKEAELAVPVRRLNDSDGLLVMVSQEEVEAVSWWR